MKRKHQPGHRSVPSGPKPGEEISVWLPPAVWFHNHGAMARLDAMEEVSRRAIAAGRPSYRYIVKAPKKSVLELATHLPILGPDGKPMMEGARP